MISKTPAMPCVDEVLNLLSQAGNLLDTGVLAEAYHLTATNDYPGIKCWLKTDWQHHVHSRLPPFIPAPIRRVKGQRR